MAKTTTNPFTQDIKNPAIVLLNADGACGTSDYGTSPSNTKLFATAGAEGSVIKAIIVSANEAKTLQFFLSPDAGTTKYLLFTVAIAANAGVTTVINQDILAASTVAGLTIDQSGRPVILLQPTYRLYVGATVAVTASKTVYVVGMQEDF